MNNNNFIKEFLDKKNIFAVIGVSKNPEKYGHQIYQKLKKEGYKVYPINPNVSEILGNKCYSKLNELPTTPDIINIVVPPKITKEIVKECKELGINKVWMQPGSENREAIDYCKKNGIKVLYNICILIGKKGFNKSGDKK
jgi:predicted CoA-binding protein